MHRERTALEDLRRIDLLQLQRRIASALAADLAHVDDIIVERRFRKIVAGYLTETHLFRTEKLFRARLNFADCAFKLPSDLWHPPAEKVGRGRFNDAGEPRFYLSNRFAAAIFELHPPIGSTVTVLEVRKSDPAAPLVCGSLGLSRCTAPEVIAGTRDLINSRQAAEIRSDKRAAARWDAIDNFLGDVSLAECAPGGEDTIYKASNAIARIWSTMPGFDALQYPSVATDLSAVNFCLPPNRADALFEPGRAWQVAIDDFQKSLVYAAPSKKGFYRMRVVADAELDADRSEYVWRQLADGEVRQSDPRQPDVDALLAAAGG